MSIKVPLIGVSRLCSLLVANWGTLRLHLYANNVTPKDTDTLASYVELAAPWYSPQDITDWTGPLQDALGNEVYTAAMNTFTVTTRGGAYAVYGHYVTDGAGNLLWAERLVQAPLVMASLGQQLPIAPTFAGRSAS